VRVSAIEAFSITVAGLEFNCANERADPRSKIEKTDSMHVRVALRLGINPRLGIKRLQRNIGSASCRDMDSEDRNPKGAQVHDAGGGTGIQVQSESLLAAAKAIHNVNET
jgi:hypothetical protein